MRGVAAIDVGGTFTDISLADLDQGLLWTTKIPTTPDDPSQGFAVGMAKVLQQVNKTPDEIIAVLHGATVATNLIIERKGSPLALSTTQGCRYVLHIGRHDVPKRAANMYLWVKPPRLVTPEHIYEVPERLDHTGKVLPPLDEARTSSRQHCQPQRVGSRAGLTIYPRPLADGRRAPVESNATRQVYFPVLGGFIDCPVYA